MDETRLSDAVAKHRTMVFRLAYSYTGSCEDAEDISQDVFLKLYQSNKRFNDDEHMKAWLLRVTVNAAKALLRSSWRKRRADLLCDDVPCYQDAANRELFDCVMRLAPKYKAVIYMYYYEDYPVKEIARIMKISETAVTTRLGRGREQLKRTYSTADLKKEETLYES